MYEKDMVLTVHDEFGVSESAFSTRGIRRVPTGAEKLLRRGLPCPQALRKEGSEGFPCTGSSPKGSQSRKKSLDCSALVQLKWG